ncbi:MAG TPA: multiheme c-type cytochrome [Anaeromyxobacter sp.]
MIQPVVLAALVASAVSAPESRSGAQSCQPCHVRETPGVVRVWAESAHGRAKIGCAECHGADGPRNHPSDGARAAVEASACRRCHPKAAAQHAASKHGIGFRAGRGCTRGAAVAPGAEAGCAACHEPGSAQPRERAECARFLTQSPAMQRQGCTACHAIEARCDTCHGAHRTERAVARDPVTCATCHMGPDHAQYEMWKTSRHGAVYAVKGLTEAPDCATCHMPEGTHDVGQGISMDLAGNAYPAERRERERARMLDVCARCHTRTFARRQLADGDTVQRESKALVEQAVAIVRDLDRLGLLDPAPASRPPHPLSGPRLELGPQMLYENLSRPEAILFRMKKFSYVTAYKGVFHQNPDYAHWYGNAPLKLALSELQSESALLRKLRLVEERLGRSASPAPADSAGTAGALLGELRELRERRVRGELDDAALERRQREVLERAGR